MNKIPSSRFRVSYISLTEPTEVTVLGRVIGTWTPVAARPDPVDSASLDWHDVRSSTVNEGGRATEPYPAFIETHHEALDALAAIKPKAEWRPVPKPIAKKNRR